jgi:hypothetical protein
MKEITDNDLTLLYYGEHDDPTLAARIADSAELSARFDALCAELKLADAFEPPPRDENYGSEVWQRISPHLDPQDSQPDGRWKTWFQDLGKPRFSFAGVLSVVLVGVLAFMLGRIGTQEKGSHPLQHVTDPVAQLSDVDSQRLLTRSVSGHLEQLNLLLTQFANNAVASNGEAEQATGMLVSNRLYRQAAVSRGDLKLANFLAGLEPLLIELAYEAHNTSQTSRERMQQEVRDGLLFRVRVMNKQLNKPELST